MGGVKVVHEYANRLAQKGHVITLVYPIQLQTNFRYRLKKVLVNQYDKITGNKHELYYTPVPEVTVLVVKNISNKYIPGADAIIAVGWQTAGAVANLSLACGKKYYLLQSLETYFGNVKGVLHTYHLPLKKIAISNWIIKEINSLNETALGPLGNAINTSEFYIESDNTNRPFDVMVIYHPSKIKGAKDALTVLKTLKGKNQKLTTVLVAPRQPIHHIPKWISVYIKPDIDTLRKLYNSSKVFLHTSFWEGWGLPVMEAIACGCAVAAYSNNGVGEFLKHNKNAQLTDIGRKDLMVQCVQNLLDNHQLIKALTAVALRDLKKYKWDNCIHDLELIIKIDN